MKKRGYMLVETLIVSVTVTSILIYLYSQFTNVQTFYNDVYKYNNVNELYLAGTIKELVISNNPSIVNDINSNAINICSSINSCTSLKTSYKSSALLKINKKFNVKNIIVAKANTDTNYVKNLVDGNSSYSKTIKEFSKIMVKQEKKYRIVVEYSDPSTNEIQVATVVFDE